jgi:hypothetical protein
MGDRKPSQFLRHLKGLAPEVPDDFLRTIWASRLPSHVQAILAGQTDGSLESTSQIADRICEVALQPTAAGISTAAPDNTTALLKRMDDLSHQVAALWVFKTPDRSQSKDRHRSQSRDRRNNQDYSSVPRGICWYHWKFVDLARRCNLPFSHQQRDRRQQPGFQQQGNFPSRCQRRSSPAP